MGKDDKAALYLVSLYVTYTPQMFVFTSNLLQDALHLLFKWISSACFKMAAVADLSPFSFFELASLPAL